MTKLNTLPPRHVNHDGAVPPTMFGRGFLCLDTEQPFEQAVKTAALLLYRLHRVDPTSTRWRTREARLRKVAEQN